MMPRHTETEDMSEATLDEAQLLALATRALERGGRFAILLQRHIQIAEPFLHDR